MIEIILFILLVLGAAAVILLILLYRASTDSLDLRPLLEAAENSQDRTERAVRDEIARNREEAGRQGKELRGEVQELFKGLSGSMLQTLRELSALQKSQLEAFAGHLGKLTDASQANAKQLREEIGGGLKGFNDSVLKQMTELANLQKTQLDAFSSQLGKLTEANEKRMEALRATIDGRLKQIQDDNTKKLDQMRATVEEKLQGTLEKRLGESFKVVSERLEQVHKGLGEMQNLATGVGDLKRVLTNVKTRGTWGEIRLDALLEQVLAPEQYDRNVAPKDGGERVEFAIRLPGRGDDGQEEVWLPIDAKFPQEDYQRLLEAQETADAGAAESAARQLDMSIRRSAKDICDKYLNPPKTTDFAIMFLPTEGLYAEVIRRTGLIEIIQRECRVVVAGPTTLAALLNSLQMGFRTLAIQKRSSEVWGLLGAVKTEFGRFGDLLEGVKKKLDQASNQIDKASRKSRTIERKLRTVQELPGDEPELLLAAQAVEAEPDGDGA